MSFFNKLSLIFLFVLAGTAFLNQFRDGGFDSTRPMAMSVDLNLENSRGLDLEKELVLGEENKKEISNIKNILEVNVYGLWPVARGEEMKRSDLIREEMLRVAEEKEIGFVYQIDSAPPHLSAHAVLVYDLTNGHKVFSLNGDSVWPLASVTKLMTTVVAVEEVGFNTYIEFSEGVVKGEEAGGGFEAGEVFTVRDILTATFLVSSNNGVMAIAEYYGKESFIKRMNSKAAELGMSDTVFTEPVGLSLSSAGTVNDLKKIVEYIYYNRPEIFYFSRQKQANIKDIRFGNEKKYDNMIVFSGQSGFIGGKTGWLPESGGNFMALFEDSGRILMIAVLGSDDRFGDTERLLKWVKGES